MTTTPQRTVPHRVTQTVQPRSTLHARISFNLILMCSVLGWGVPSIGSNCYNVSAPYVVVLLREDELKRAESEIQRLTTSSEAKVDKLIIKNLILGYFHTPTNKRPEVLTLLGKVLGFSRDELQQVGANESNVGWLKGMFRRTVTPVPTSPATPNKASAFFSDRSFSEMFVKFLERESSPQPEMRLPAEAMAREQQEKQRQKPPAFNPFSVPASAPSSPGGNLSLSNAHILMKPMGGALPMFSPVMPTSVVSGMGTSGTPPTGRRSATSSGRSTPASVILKDVLQQQ